MTSRRQATNDDLFWGTKVIRRHVDPITFALQEDVVGIPRIEETSHETTDLAVSQKPLLKLKQDVNDSNSKNASTACTATNKRKDIRNGRKPSTPLSPDPQRRAVSMPVINATSSRKKTGRSRSRSPKGKVSSSNGSSPTKSKQSRPKKEPTVKKQKKPSSDTTLGAFLQRNTAHQVFQQEAKRVLSGGGLFDNRSVGSGRSMATMSVSDRSIAERSKAEESLAKRAKQWRAARERQAAAIDEMSVSDFSHISNVVGGGGDNSFNNSLPKSPLRSKGSRGLRERRKLPVEDVLQENEEEDDNQVAPETRTKLYAISTVSKKIQITGILRKQSLEDSLDLEDAVVSREDKNLRFRDEHSEKYISTELTNSMYGDLFWTPEELAEFRYEAFMEEAGLDINEFG